MLPAMPGGGLAVVADTEADCVGPRQLYVFRGRRVFRGSTVVAWINGAITILHCSLRKADLPRCRSRPPGPPTVASVPLSSREGPHPSRLVSLRGAVAPSHSLPGSPRS